MNLAIEYLIRSGIAKESLSVPCAIYLDHTISSFKKVVTIHWHEFSSTYLVKQWNLYNFPEDGTLPLFEEHTINTKEELFTNKNVIIPNYRLIEFVSKTPKPGVRQRTTGSRATDQERQYQEILRDFYNPEDNKVHRLNWIWKRFMVSQLPAVSDVAQLTLYTSEQRHIIETYYPHIWAKWILWTKHLCYESYVATELIFHESYGENIAQKFAEKVPSIIYMTRNGNKIAMPYQHTSIF